VLLTKTFQKLARALQPIGRSTTKTTVANAASKQEQKAAGKRSATKTKTERERTECFGYFDF
jgi:hypothetical protein